MTHRGWAGVIDAIKDVSPGLSFALQARDRSRRDVERRAERISNLLVRANRLKRSDFEVDNVRQELIIASVA